LPLWAAIGGQDVARLPSASTCYNTLKVLSPWGGGASIASIYWLNHALELVTQAGFFKFGFC